jgi:hypothetical protein
MPSREVLFSVLGPLLDIGPRVALAMAAGLVTLAALRIAALAFCARRSVAFLSAWALGIAVFSAYGSVF